jgi:hypothetical protein
MREYLIAATTVICVSLIVRLYRKEKKPKEKSIFHVTATPETQAQMALWRQREASPVPDDLVILDKLSYTVEDIDFGHCVTFPGRRVYNHVILVDFGSGSPEFHLNEDQDKVPGKYPPFERNGCTVYGMYAISPEPLYGNVWECRIDYFKENKYEPKENTP